MWGFLVPPTAEEMGPEWGCSVPYVTELEIQE